MKKRICALLLAAVLVYMPYALAAAILTPLNHPAAQGTAWAAYEQEAAAQTPGAQRVRVLEHSDEALLWRRSAKRRRAACACASSSTG